MAKGTFPWLSIIKESSSSSSLLLLGGVINDTNRIALSHFWDQEVNSISFLLQLNSSIVPTNVLTNPEELERALQSGIQAQAVNGYAFDPGNGGGAGAYPEPYQQVCAIFCNDDKIG